MLPNDFNNIPVPKNVPQHKLLSTVLQECPENFNNVLSIMIMSQHCYNVPCYLFHCCFYMSFPCLGGGSRGPGPPPLSESLGIYRLL